MVDESCFISLHHKDKLSIGAKLSTHEEKRDIHADKQSNRQKFSNVTHQNYSLQEDYIMVKISLELKDVPKIPCGGLHYIIV